MSIESQEAVLIETRDHVRIITINRPQARNAINREVTDLLGRALHDADADRDIRAVVLTGAGTSAFCAGADLKALAAGERIDATDRDARRWGFAGVVEHPISTPIIAAVNGFALGGGTELVLAADLAIAAETAQFGLPEVKRGIYAAAGGAFRFAGQIPPKLAMEYLLTGKSMDAARAAELGLINRVVAADELLSAATTLAEQIAANAPVAVQATKRLARGIIDGDIPDERAAWDANKAEARTVFSSADAAEGPRAFAEKRDPIWSGR
ncbi:crotonase/enoyl-CoA hydratase family protein [Williamsia soli]|uniref:crotonase/enoyl-CoA hydratase family protein n=1 Tax=Williamsia soli TaxID=364929 RepID=UPI001A9E03C3|nr:crotonase/enoyl-CoA hydratase family protein [Williamsia soli]